MSLVAKSLLRDWSRIEVGARQMTGGGADPGHLYGLLPLACHVPSDKLSLKNGTIAVLRVGGVDRK